MKFHPSSVLPSDVLKWLEEMEEICTSSIECIQRGMDRSVLVTFRDEETANFVADLDTVQINGINVLVTMVDQTRTWVKVYYLPFEVTNNELADALREFGHVHSVRQDKMSLHEDVYNGIRTVSMTIRKSIPSYIAIDGFDVYVFYRGQAKTCRICQRTGHLQKNCPEIRCFNCRKYGHTANECGEFISCEYCHEIGHRVDRCPERIEEEQTQTTNTTESRSSRERIDNAHGTMFTMVGNQDDENTTKTKDSTTMSSDGDTSEESDVDSDVTVGSLIIDLDDNQLPPARNVNEHSQANSKGNNDWKLVTNKRKKGVETEKCAENVEKVPKR